MARKYKINVTPLFRHDVFISPVYYLGFEKELQRYIWKMWKLDDGQFRIFSTICMLCDISVSHSTCKDDVFRTFRLLVRPGSRHIAAYHKIFELGLVERKQITFRGLSIVVTAKGMLVMQDAIDQFRKFIVKKNNVSRCIDKYGHMKYLSDVVADETK